MRRPRILSRDSHVVTIRSALERDHWPRLQMMFIVMLTGLAGLLASFLMLQAGVLGMGKRYFFAMCCAYIMFLFLLWVWMRMRDEAADAADLGLDVADAALQLSPDLPSFGGRGGSFDGGGASGNWDAASLLDGVGNTVGDAGKGIGEAVGEVAGGADEAAIPIAVVLLGLAIVFSSLFVVWSAPVLFAELLLDGVLSAGLYSRLRNVDRRHWLETALRRTALPFLLTAALVTGAGWWMGTHAPGAHTLGQVLDYQPAEAANKR